MPNYSTSPVRFASSTISIPSATSSIHLKTPVSYSNRSYELASHAFHGATGFSNDTLSDFTLQQQSVISAVASALERSLSDPEFASLPAQQQEEAAMRLIKQCQRGLQVAHAIQSAMLNPATMSHQLRAYATGNSKLEVLDQIIRAHRPSTVISSQSVVTAARIYTLPEEGAAA